MKISQNYAPTADPALIPKLTDQDGLTCVINDTNGDYLATRFGFYFLPENRNLRPCKYIAFYKNDEITHVYQILNEASQITTLEESELLQRVAAITPVQPQTKYRIIKLKYHKALAPVVNDLTRDASGRTVPYTLYQRYTGINNLLSAFYTSQLKDALDTDPHNELDFAYIDHLRAKGLPVPENEAQRLEELHRLDIWGTRPEPEFDNLTRLACAICKTPIAMIALVGREYNWLKSEVGFGGVQEATRDFSFCQYTVFEENFLEVKDATHDRRFADNPYVTGAPNIRFYAAAPLMTEQGNALGSLCVINSTPQELSEEQRTLLRHLAQEVVLRLQLRKKNKELETMNSRMEDAMTELKATQTHTVELYQSLTDSIRYARRIQEVVLPNEATLRTIWENAFVYYHPKDIVSGDFYTVFERRNKLFISVGDCTGHGVPGAFMTFIGINAISKIINERGISEPSNILEELDDEITRVLHQEAHSTFNRDGMDIAFCVIDRERMTVSVAGAQRSVWIVREQEIKELKGDRFPVAGGYAETKVFRSVTESLKPGDCLYIFTDGITDQFGWSEDRIQKYSYRRLREFLTRIHLLPMAMQKSEFEKELKAWRQDTPQTDDQLFIGIKF